MAAKFKWALGASVILNLFLLAAMGGSAFVVKKHCDAKPRMPVASAWRDATKDMTPEARDRVVALIKQAALSGEPDMAKARDLRTQAAQLAAATTFEPARVAALSDEARGYEDQARAKVENAMIQGMTNLQPDERKVVADHLLTASFRFRFFLMKDETKGAAAQSSGPAK